MLNNRPGLDDDELSRVTGVAPRQQVNQICRLLESRGLLRREKGPRGKIVNYLKASSPGGGSRHASRDPVTSTRVLKGKVKHPDRYRSRLDPRALRCDPRSTLFLFPCSGSKDKKQFIRIRGPSILDELPAALARRLAEARKQIQDRAQLDQTSLIPAWQRYTGTLYRAGGDTIGAAVASGIHLIIVSGGYGLVLAAEPIGYYEARFKASWWPKGVLEDVILNYLQRHQIRAVRAIASMTTDYAKLLRRVNWHLSAVDDAWLLTPEEAKGAMIKSPRAQGEALSGLLQGGLDANWESSDGLRLTAEPLV